MAFYLFEPKHLSRPLFPPGISAAINSHRSNRTVSYPKPRGFPAAGVGRRPFDAAILLDLYAIELQITEKALLLGQARFHHPRSLEVSVESADGKDFYFVHHCYANLLRNTMAFFSIIMNFTLFMNRYRRFRSIILAILLQGIATLLLFAPEKPKFTEVSRETAQRSVFSYRADTAKTLALTEEQFDAPAGQMGGEHSFPRDVHRGHSA